MCPPSPVSPGHTQPPGEEGLGSREGRELRAGRARSCSRQPLDVPRLSRWIKHGERAISPQIQGLERALDNGSWGEAPEPPPRGCPGPTCPGAPWHPLAPASPGPALPRMKSLDSWKDESLWRGQIPPGAGAGCKTNCDSSSPGGGGFWAILGHSGPSFADLRPSTGPELSPGVFLRPRATLSCRSRGRKHVMRPGPRRGRTDGRMVVWPQFPLSQPLFSTSP